MSGDVQRVASSPHERTRYAGMISVGLLQAQLSQPEIRAVIIAVVVLELIVCLAASVVVGVGNADDSGQAAFPLQVWLVCAILQLTIRYLPPSRHARYRLWLFVTLILFAGVTSGRIEPFPHFHQALFIAAVAALPQLWWAWSAKTPERRALGLGLIGLVSLPLGFAAWSFANIWIVKVEAWRASNGEPYCIFVSDGRLFSGGYRQAPDDWSLSGWRMVSGRGAGGSGNCCQWDFHALLLTRNDELFKWSYRSQRFENVSERTRQLMTLNVSRCQ